MAKTPASSVSNSVPPTPDYPSIGSIRIFAASGRVNSTEGVKVGLLINLQLFFYPGRWGKNKFLTVFPSCKKALFVKGQKISS